MILDVMYSTIICVLYIANAYKLIILFPVTVDKVTINNVKKIQKRRKKKKLKARDRRYKNKKWKSNQFWLDLVYIGIITYTSLNLSILANLLILI